MLCLQTNDMNKLLILRSRQKQPFSARIGKAVKRVSSGESRSTAEKSQHNGDLEWLSATLIASTEPKTWSGVLHKKGRALLRPWQPRWFELKGTETGQALLVYSSPNKGDRSLHVEDARRELHLDSGVRIAFSLGVAPASPPAARDPAAPPPAGGGERGRRLLLMAATDLEAVAFLSCLRGILAPGSARPTLRDALHYPGDALARLVG